MQQNNAETLGNFSLNAEAIAADYFEGESAYARHLELSQNAEAGLTPAEYAKSIGISRSSHRQEYNNRHAAMQRFLDGRYPPAIQSLVALQTLGILQGAEPQSFDIHNNHFELLSMLSAFGFLTGNLTPTGSPALSNRTTKDLVLLTRDAADPEAIDKIDTFIEGLKGKGICTPYEGTRRGGRVVAPVARLIALMNKIVGSKAETDQVFPEIFERAHNSLRIGDQQEEVETARRMLRDFSLAFFAIRTTHRPEHGYSGWIPAHEDEEISRQRRDVFQETLHASGFGDLPCRLSPEVNPYTNKRGKEKNSYLTRVCFPGITKETIANIRTEFGDRLGAVL